MKRQRNKIKIIFFGSDSFSVPILESLRSNFEVVLVVTKDDREAGRGKKLKANPLKRFAEKLKLKLLIIEKLDGENIEKIKNIKADIYLVAAFGLMIPKTLLKSPAGIDTINVHPSLLPLYRGPSPIESAILAGDKKTGVSIMVLDDKMDHGPIIAQEEEAIDDEYDDFITLSERLEKLAAKMIIDVIPKFINHQINPRPQNHQATTTCKLIKKEDGKIDFKKDANNVLRHIRAFVHWPGSYTTWKVEPRGAESAEASRAEHGRIVRVEHRERRRKKNKTIKIIEARLQNQLPEPPFTAGMVFKTSNGKPAIICGNQAIVIETIQIEGKKPTDSISFLNGYPDFIGGNLG